MGAFAPCRGLYQIRTDQAIGVCTDRPGWHRGGRSGRDDRCWVMSVAPALCPQRLQWTNHDTASDRPPQSRVRHSFFTAGGSDQRLSGSDPRVGKRRGTCPAPQRPLGGHLSHPHCPSRCSRSLLSLPSPIPPSPQYPDRSHTRPQRCSRPGSCPESACEMLPCRSGDRARGPLC